MLNVETRHAIDPKSAKAFDTDTLRQNFHLGALFGEGQINLVYTHYDRMIIGGAVPAGQDLVLDKVSETGTDSILDRREMVIANIGDAGTVRVAGKDYTVASGEMLYIGMGTGAVTFSGAGHWGTPADIGDTAVFLASRAAKYIHGAILNVDGGWLAR